MKYFYVIVVIKLHKIEFTKNLKLSHFAKSEKKIQRKLHQKSKQFQDDELHRITKQFNFIILEIESHTFLYNKKTNKNIKKS